MGGGCCHEPNNSVVSRELPHLHPQLCFWNMTREVFPHQKSLLPSAHVYPEEELGSTGTGSQQSKGQPDLGFSSLLYERLRSPGKKLLLPAFSSLPPQGTWARLGDCEVQALSLLCQLPQYHQAGP